MGDHEAQGDAGLELRVSDAERDEVIGVLREQTSAGRLTLEEFEERLGEVYEARTAGALRHVLRELPVQPATPRPGGSVGPRSAPRTSCANAGDGVYGASSWGSSCRTSSATPSSSSAT